MSAYSPGQRARLLQEHLAYCERNYQLWRSIFPREHITSGLLDAGDFGKLRYEIVDKSKYTQTYCLTLKPQIPHEQHGWLTFVLPVRIYHDLCVAEVLLDDRGKQYPGFSPYPNSRMWLPDEKLRLNAHLFLWLSACTSADQVKKRICQST